MASRAGDRPAGDLRRPLASLLLQLPPLLLLMVSQHNESNMFTWMGAFGHLMPKPSHLLGNHPGLNQLARVWTQNEKTKHAKRLSKLKKDTGFFGGGFVGLVVSLPTSSVQAMSGSVLQVAIQVRCVELMVFVSYLDSLYRHVPCAKSPAPWRRPKMS